MPRPARAAGLPPASRRLLAAASVLATALLFLAYLQVSRTYPENSDESNDLLMAWDMLHGNALLHGWHLSDVSFLTTELPQYALVVALLGLHTGTAHVAAAMTYTLVVVLAVLLARGGAASPDGWLRILLTAGIIFAPQLGVAVFVLLLSLGHIGTAVPVMLTWLVLDRLRPRWPAARPAGSRAGCPPAWPRSGTRYRWRSPPSSRKVSRRCSAGYSGPAAASSCTRCPTGWHPCIPGPSMLT